ncbi:calcium-binding protein [Achromobacter xylosoxidans]|uniref:calcium-binding protein n=1 Tax=Alcaligenes xylosoxydans xylosoxydans TaxID=85698 RepID=UPI0003323E17|nr:calcium-binding protein [Achromobacter xylosoxidans]CCH07014.1 Alkaline phosphatase [Achromobacter xylosoxidans NH44784-1996]CUJ18381.1 Cyclolysin [Achromobacter xylosoxidans]CUJ94531.1 Cyclolysin [Achromobacter xylosoxidans]
MPTQNIVNFSDAQIAILQGHLQSGQYAEAYKAAATAVKADPGYSQNAELQRLVVWLDTAAKINGEPTSIIGAFVRGELKAAADLQGASIDASQFQEFSNRLALRLMTDAVNNKGMPNAAEVVNTEVLHSVVTEMQLPAYQWPGVAGDWLPPPFGLGKDYVSVEGSDVVDYLNNFQKMKFAQLEGMRHSFLVQVEDLASEFGESFARMAVKAAGGTLDGIFGRPSRSLGEFIGDYGDEVFARLLSMSGRLRSAWSSFKRSVLQISPLVIDLTGNGVNLTQLDENSPYFDLNGDGFARKTGWIGAGTGLLCLDPENMGISDISQLFGSNNGIDGFSQLRRFDSNNDGIIDNKDPIFGKLRLWLDTDHNGVSTGSELHTLEELGIAAIGLTATAVDLTVAGNKIDLIGSVMMADGSTRQVADAWFTNSPSLTRPVASVNISDQVKLLPQLIAAGSIRDLRSAMMLDPALLQMVSAFQQLGAETSAEATEAAFTAIMYRWGAVDQVSPNARGIDIDGRKLAFIEKYLGMPFESASNGTTPRFRASTDLNSAWSAIYDSMLARMVLQSGLAATYGKAFEYSVEADMILPAGGFRGAFAQVLTTFGQPGPDNQGAWNLAFKIANAVRIDLGLVVDYYHDIVDLGGSNTIASLATLVANGLRFTIEADRSIVVYGSAVNDVIYAPDGASVLYGGGGGNNWALELPYNDVFVIGRSATQVEIIEREGDASSASNLLKFISGIRSDQAIVSSNAHGDVVITIANGPVVVIDAMLLKPINGVQQVEFSDGVTWTREQVISHLSVGAGSDYIVGTSAGEVLDGGGGNDYILGGGGADTYLFNAGYGLLTINQAEGAPGVISRLRFGAGIDARDITVKSDATGNLILLHANGTDKVVLELQASRPKYGVGVVEFADGSTWTRQQLLQMSLTGSGAMDNIYGTTGADFIDGKGGTDYLKGRGGNDIFYYASGYGHVIIDEEDFARDAQNVLRFGAGISLTDLRFSVTSDGDVTITHGVPGDEIVIRNMAGWDYSGVQRLEFANGESISKPDFLARTQYGSSGSDTLYGSRYVDSIDGLGGDDTVYARGGGGDVFVFNQGYGHLTIDSYDALRSDMSTLKLGPGILATNIQIRLSGPGGQDISVLMGTDTVTLIGMGADPSRSGVDRILFSDGTILNAAEVAARAHQISGSAGSDTLTGTLVDDIFDGKGGDDVISGGGGNDVFLFERGYGRLTIDQYRWSDQHRSTLRFGAGIGAADVAVSALGDPFGGSIALTMGADRVVLKGMALGVPGFGVQLIQFADGTSWTAEQILAAARDVRGTADSEILYGTPWDDVFRGNGGNDVLFGNGGNDVFLFEKGDGQIEIVARSYVKVNNVVRLGAGIQVEDVSVTMSRDGEYDIFLNIGSDRIKLKKAGQVSLADAPTGFDLSVPRIEFADGTVWAPEHLLDLARRFEGNSGDDNLVGTYGADRFDGHGGDDYIAGHGGGDTFIFNQGYGRLVIDEFARSANEVNVLRFGTGIAPQEVSMKIDEQGNVVMIIGTDQVVLSNMAAGLERNGVQRVEFADGTTWTRQQIHDRLRTIQGDAGGQTLYGTDLADRIDGGGGPDVLYGKEGDDTYVYKLGYGIMTIADGEFGVDAANVLEFGAGIDASMITAKAGLDGSLTLLLGPSGGAVVLQNMLRGRYWGVQEVKFADGVHWNRDDVLALISTIGSSGNDALTGTSDADYFDGQGGDDTVNGMGGGDTIIFNAGYGKLRISEPYWPALPENVVVLGAGLSTAAAQIKALRNGDISLTFAGTSDQITFAATALFGGVGIPAIVFADGTRWSGAEVFNAAMQLTPGDDVLFGNSSAEYFDGLGGNDYIFGGGGGDTFIYKPGYGHLEIYENDYAGTNTLKFGTGIDPGMMRIKGNSTSGIEIIDRISGGKVTLTNAMYGAGYGLQRVEFSDGTVWTASQLRSAVSNAVATTEDDALFGTEVAEVFDGLGGGDYIQGGGGGDTFHYKVGYGRLEILEVESAGATNVLKFGPGISASSMQVVGADDLSITLKTGATGDAVVLSMAMSPAAGVQRIDFEDGTSWTGDDVRALLRRATTGNDVLFGSLLGPDRLDGLGGIDTVYGNGGNDTYVLGAGYGGQLTIFNGYMYGGADGKLELDVSADRLWLQRSGQDLKVSIMGTDASAVLRDWYKDDFRKLAAVQSGGEGSATRTLDANLDILVQAMASFERSHPGFDPTLSQNAAITDSTVLAVVASSWHA